MIQTKRIVVQNDDPPNVTKNLLAHNDVHFIEMVCDDKEYENSLNSQKNKQLKLLKLS